MWYSPAGTVVAGQVITRETGVQGDTWRREKSWAESDPDLGSLITGQRVGLKQEDFTQKKKKKKALSHCLKDSCTESGLMKREEEEACYTPN